jgi:hypothetical protein
MRSATGGGEKSPEEVARDRLAAELHEAVDATEKDVSHHRDVADAHDALMEHDGVDRETYSRAGVEGPEGRSMESRDWARRLLSGEVSIFERRGRRRL